MAFGFGIGDMILVLDLCHTVCKTLRNAPGEYRECQSELNSVTIAVETLVESAKDPKSSLGRHDNSKKRNLAKVVSALQEPLQELQELVEIHSAIEDDGRGRAIRVWKRIRFGMQDIEAMRDTLNFHLLSINLFLKGLDGFSMGRVEEKLDRIYAMLKHNAVGNSLDLTSCEVSFMSTRSSVILSEIKAEGEDAWEGIKDALEAEDIAPEQIQAHRNEIFQYCKALLAKDPPSEASMALSGLVRPHADLKMAEVSSTTTLVNSPQVLPQHPGQPQGLGLDIYEYQSPNSGRPSRSPQVTMSDEEARQLAGYEAAINCDQAFGLAPSRTNLSIPSLSLRSHSPIETSAPSSHQPSPREEQPPLFASPLYPNERDRLIDTAPYQPYTQPRPVEQPQTIRSTPSTTRSNSFFSGRSLSSTPSTAPTSVMNSRSPTLRPPSFDPNANASYTKPSTPRTHSSKTSISEKSTKSKTGRAFSNFTKSFKMAPPTEQSASVMKNPFQGAY